MSNFQRNRESTGSRRLALIAWTAAIAFVWSPRAHAAPQFEEQPVDTNSFSIPETLLVRALFERATEHVAARRFAEAIADLQQILEKHEGELLPGDRPKSTAGRASEGIVHAGASVRARALLLALPFEARTRYRERYEVEAGRALAVARSAHDVQGLIGVGRRWPITEAALAAFVAVGDIEFERGREREAAFAWARAIGIALSDSELKLDDVQEWTAVRERLRARTDDPTSSALLARVALVTARSDARRRADLTTEQERNLRLPNSNVTLGPAPSETADAWAAPFQLPAHPFRDSMRDSLFAVRTGERLFVSNSLRLMCLHAYTGELLWDSNEPVGWAELSRGERAELFLGIDRHSLIAPATSDAVVVAALQLPLSQLRSDSYGQIKILTPIPERRLFAFDVVTGRKLWDHMPPPAWDGEEGTFAQRTTIAAPPVIVGSRVLVPCVRMQGRINYNVGCFDLYTGALIWSRDVISGQREQNMFGRAEHEFSAAPLCVEGDKVIALTQLGTIAALDLFTGELLWETLHETISTPRAQGFSAPQYQPEWRNCPPVVQSGVVLAVPFNSRDLVAIDLATGVLLWSHDVKSIRALTRDGRADVLFGAAKDSIYVGGDRWVSLHMPSGVGQRGALRAKAEAREDDTVAVRSRAGRPVLAQDRIIDPRVTERFDFDRETGAKIASIRWPPGSQGGNVLLGAGEMFVVSGSEVRGYFEWEVLVGRARTELAQAADDPARVLRLARLLEGRGSAEWQRGESESARAHLTEARTILERVLRAAPDAAGGDLRAQLSGVYHSILKSGARVRSGLADSNGALNDLRKARAYAPDASALRDTLVEELVILFERQNTAGADPTAVNAALDELERSCAELPLAVGFRIPTDAASTPFGFEFYPLPAARAEDSTVPSELPVGLWVLIERGGQYARAGDTAREFAALHAILERYPTQELLAWTAGELSKQRIAALLASGRTAGYETFEARAQALYDEGVRSHDDALLRRVVERYPGSKAARSANDARLDIALQSDDLATVARIVRTELSAGLGSGAIDARTLPRLLRLAAALGTADNQEARSGLLKRLAVLHGDFVSDVPGDQGATIAQLAARAPEFFTPVRGPGRGTFSGGTDEASGRALRGDYQLLGEVLPKVPLQQVPADTPTTLMFARTTARATASLVAFSSEDPTVERWSVDLAPRTAPQSGANGVWNRRAAWAAGRLMVATSEKIVAVDTEAGAQAWEWMPDAQTDTMSITSASGIAVVVVTPRGERDRWTVYGLDAATGVELWDNGTLDAAVQRFPIVSESRAVFLPTPGHKQVIVVDLFTGLVASRFELETPVSAAADADAWVEGDLLIVPWFNQASDNDRNQVLAVDLDTGRRVWRVALEVSSGARWLAGVLQQADRTWLLLQARPESEPNRIDQSLAALDTRIGALTPLAAVRIGMEDRILGLGRPARVAFAPGPLAVLSPRVGGGRGAPRDARVRCIDLDRGELWVQGLGIAFDELAPGILPMPATSDTILAVVTVGNTTSGPGVFPRADLRAFDLQSGLPRGVRGVHMSEVRDAPQLIPFGGTLVVRTKTQLEFLK